MYIVKLYITLSPVLTSTGFFLWLYVAVVPEFNVLNFMFGTLDSATSVPFTLVIYFLSAKSNVFSKLTTVRFIVFPSIVTLGF